VFNVIGAHPLARRQGGEGRIQTVHMEQEGTIVTLDEWRHPATPSRGKKRYSE
jgi:hypothetical protein